MRSTTIAFQLLPALVAAAPSANPNNSPPNTCSPVDVLANFDDITVNPAANIAPVPTPYKGLYYQAFSPSQPTISAGLPGVVPHSPPNYIYTSANGQTTAGTAMISVNYPKSTVKSFTPKSLYFACVSAQLNSAVGVPVECFATLSGYKGNDNQVANSVEVCSQQLHYLPSTALGPQQMGSSGPLASCFQDVQFLIVTLNTPGTTSVAQPLTSLQFDDFAYSYKTC